MPMCKRARAGVGEHEIPVMEEIKANICFQKELKDLQNHSVCAMEPILPQFLQQDGDWPGYILDSR